MSKVEAFFHEIDVKNWDEMVLIMKNANMNISALLSKTSETDTSADTYFDKLAVTKDDEDAAEILLNSLKKWSVQGREKTFHMD